MEISKIVAMEKHSFLVRWAVLLAIIVVLNIFFFVALRLVFPTPEYATFCPATVGSVPSSKETCLATDGIWVPYPPVGGDTSGPKSPDTYGSCDTYSKCQPLYDAAQKEYSKKAFLFMIIVGILALLLGLIPLGSSIVSAGFSYGGVLALVMGSAIHWSEAGSYLKLSISGLALMVLIYIGIKHFKD
jgi:hypothetical protein